MAKKRSARTEAQVRATQPARLIRWWRWTLIGATGAAVIALLLLVAGGVGSEGGSSATAAAAGGTSAAAEPVSGAREGVRVLRGGVHAVRHSQAPLPTNASPRADGRPTLVWFSATWCEVCELMEPFAGATAGQFADRIVFVEKSVDDDRGAASRFVVRGTPTFVLINASGGELARFFFQPSAAAFQQAIEAALRKGGA